MDGGKMPIQNYRHMYQGAPELPMLVPNGPLVASMPDAVSSSSVSTAPSPFTSRKPKKQNRCPFRLPKPPAPDCRENYEMQEEGDKPRVLLAMALGLDSVNSETFQMALGTPSIKPRKKHYMEEGKRRYETLGLNKRHFRAFKPGTNWNEKQLVRWLKENPVKDPDCIQFLLATLNETVYGFGQDIDSSSSEEEEQEEEPQQQQHDLARQNENGLMEIDSQPGLAEGILRLLAAATMLPEFPLDGIEAEAEPEQHREPEPVLNCEEYYNRQPVSEKAQVLVAMAIGLEGCQPEKEPFRSLLTSNKFRPRRRQMYAESRRRNRQKYGTDVRIMNGPNASWQVERLIRWLDADPIEEAECIEFVLSTLEETIYRPNGYMRNQDNNATSGNGDKDDDDDSSGGGDGGNNGGSGGRGANGSIYKSDKQGGAQKATTPTPDGAFSSSDPIPINQVVIQSCSKTTDFTTCRHHQILVF